MYFSIQTQKKTEMLSFRSFFACFSLFILLLLFPVLRDVNINQGYNYAINIASRMITGTPSFLTNVLYMRWNFRFFLPFSSDPVILILSQGRSARMLKFFFLVSFSIYMSFTPLSRAFLFFRRQIIRSLNIHTCPHRSA